MADQRTAVPEVLQFHQSATTKKGKQSKEKERKVIPGKQTNMAEETRNSFWISQSCQTRLTSGFNVIKTKEAIKDSELLWMLV
jgi:hypothetical protein